MHYFIYWLNLLAATQMPNEYPSCACKELLFLSNTIFKSTPSFYLFNMRKPDRTFVNRWYEVKWQRSMNIVEKVSVLHIFMTRHKKKVNKFSISSISSVSSCSGLRLVEWFSLTLSSINGVEVDRCSIMTYQGQNYTQLFWKFYSGVPCHKHHSCNNEFT